MTWPDHEATPGPWLTAEAELKDLADADRADGIVRLTVETADPALVFLSESSYRSTPLEAA